MNRENKIKKSIWITLIALLVFFCANLFYGNVHIPFRSVLDILFGGGGGKDSWKFIVLSSRLPQAITALFAGASLAVSGLLLQTLFKNPLAGPSILGVSSGANLGVAIVMLAFGGGVFLGSAGLGSYLLIVIAALLGSALVLGILIYFSHKVSSNVMLLIIGIMVGYLASSVISILNFYSSADKVQQFVIWGMGDFSAVSMEKLPYFVGFVSVGLIFSLLLIKPLNALLLGENYAQNLGINIKRIRVSILLVTGLLTAVVTAFCGPIAFIGLAVPHISRLMLGSSNHRSLLPHTALSGSVIALLCNILCVLPGSGLLLPLNAVTPIIGAPIIIYVIINRKNIQYFN
ncbi:MAG: iron ABC transporter permease [Bacteroidales bacterium]